MYNFKVWTSDRVQKKNFVADNLLSLKTKAQKKFNLINPLVIVLNSDGTEMDDDEVLLHCVNEILIVLGAEQLWTHEIPVTSRSEQQGSSNSIDFFTNSEFAPQPCAVMSDNSLTPLLDIKSTTNEKTLRVFPFVYSMPVLPQHISVALQKAKDKASLEPFAEHSLVRILFEDLIQYDLYPSSVMYNSVCSAIVRTYPNLCDRVIVMKGKSSKLYVTWLDSLRTKFKSERAKYSNDESVIAHKKFASKRIHSQLINDNQPVKITRLEVSNDSLEDSSSVEQHVILMLKEHNKHYPDTTIISDRMSRTYVSRRIFIKTNTTQVILQRFPCLTMEIELFEDAKRITGLDLKIKLMKFFQNRSDKILDICKSKLPSIKKTLFLQTVNILLNGIGASSNVDIEESTSFHSINNHQMCRRSKCF
ncbi:uncharacterized protein LOC136089358 isoform X2 [Hydra vulgaris]|uniref:Uncharacterized protein LOC136089358 isoform X2 n=1 Tax=Hydra vulgaris TaxID=6087 RepID=A0ABM4DAL9_HYDVU